MCTRLWLLPWAKLHSELQPASWITALPAWSAMATRTPAMPSCLQLRSSASSTRTRANMSDRLHPIDALQLRSCASWSLGSNLASMELTRTPRPTPEDLSCPRCTATTCLAPPASWNTGAPAQEASAPMA